MNIPVVLYMMSEWQHCVYVVIDVSNWVDLCHCQYCM